MVAKQAKVLYIYIYIVFGELGKRLWLPVLNQMYQAKKKSSSSLAFKVVAEISFIDETLCDQYENNTKAGKNQTRSMPWDLCANVKANDYVVVL